MALLRGCLFPDELLYDVDNNVWVKQDDDGGVLIGLTCYASVLSGNIVSFTPKKVGKEVKKGKSCATVESAQWVGPVKAPISGFVMENNDELNNEPSLLNQDPYGQGWVIKIKAENWASESMELLSGEEALEVFEAKMEAEGFSGC